MNRITSLNKEIKLLNKITNVLDEDIELRHILENVLKMMAEYLGIQRGTITILNREKSRIYIEVAYGLSNEQQNKGKYKLGEGITGKVVETGEAVVVPKISDEPQFLNKTNTREKIDEISFICVPIKYHNEILGALSADRLLSNDISLKDDVEFLSIIAYMISETVSIFRLENEKKHEYILKLKEENYLLMEKLKNKFNPSNIIGKSKSMQEVYNLISKVNKAKTTILLLGESGVGKELVANAIHYSSTRSDNPFIKFNCAALPENLIESELFGHSKGAFTGALESRKGKFEIANEGTIFLDEISEIPLNMQAKLLRVFQEKEIDPIGTEKSIKIDVTIIAATNRDLQEMVKEKTFREDLYYRLNVFPIIIPPLRKRKTDIPLLIDFFIEKYSKEFNIPVKRISTPAIDMLMQYHWPGNVRELQNCIERAILLTTDSVIRSFHLPPTLQTPGKAENNHGDTLEKQLENLEKELIMDSLKETNGNMAKAAKRLGITERIMGLRIKKYNIDPRFFKNIINN